MRRQFDVLHKILLDTVRDVRCAGLITAPGFGAVVALTYRVTITSRKALSIAEVGGMSD